MCYVGRVSYFILKQSQERKEKEEEKETLKEEAARQRIEGGEKEKDKTEDDKVYDG